MALFFLPLLLPLLSLITALAQPQLPLLTLIDTQYGIVADQLLANPTHYAYPQFGLPVSSSWNTTSNHSWTSGFLPGIFWLLSALSNPVQIKPWTINAQIAQQDLLPMQFLNQTHDVGFIIFTSFGNAYRFTHNSSYLEPIFNGANSLASRYNSKVGCTRSWNNPGHGEGPEEYFRVVIDNMMNLEILFWVANFTGNHTLYEMGFSHAIRTSYEHVREDGSTWHEVIYNSTDGAVIVKETVQGYANDSTWSRGQAWAIYGFTMAYRYTKEPRFLATAQRTADFFLRNLPMDGIPYWDFDAPFNTSYQPRDTSAAAIVASALLELGNFSHYSNYTVSAMAILDRLSTAAYLAPKSSNPACHIPAILTNGTQHYKQGVYDVALIYGDYYFLDAMMRVPNLTPEPAASPIFL